MVAAYARQAPDEVYLFEPRDHVFVEQCSAGKLLPKSLGTYVFLCYLGTMGKPTGVEGPGGRVMLDSAIHLCPAAL